MKSSPVSRKAGSGRCVVQSRVIFQCEFKKGSDASVDLREQGRAYIFGPTISVREELIYPRFEFGSQVSKGCKVLVDAVGQRGAFSGLGEQLRVLLHLSEQGKERKCVFIRV